MIPDLDLELAIPRHQVKEMAITLTQTAADHVKRFIDRHQNGMGLRLGVKPTGCSGCNYTGYRGRLGIFEIMLVDDAIREKVATNTDSKTIKATAKKQGMHSLRSDGARKVLQGITSVAEVLRATEEEGVVAQV